MPYHPSDYWTSEIIMPSISERALGKMTGRDELDGIHLDMSKIEGYVKQLVLCISILIMTVLVITHVSIAVSNLIQPPSKDVSQRVKDKLLNALNSENIGSLVAEGDSGLFSRSNTIPPNCSTPE